MNWGEGLLANAEARRCTLLSGLQAARRDPRGVVADGLASAAKRKRSVSCRRGCSDEWLERFQQFPVHLEVARPMSGDRDLTLSGLPHTGQPVERR
jgi:hypothetical protein